VISLPERTVEKTGRRRLVGTQSGGKGTLVLAMSTEYRSNHFVPQWYQRRFIPAGQVDRELYLLDLKPKRFVDGRGVEHLRKAVRRTGTRRCFAIDDLYTTRFGNTESRDLERVFFGDVDSRGRRAVDYFAGFDHTSADGDALQDLMLYMSTQKLRTPKGLDWLRGRTGAGRREDVLRLLGQLRTLYGAVWAECVWQIADATESATKLIVSDHPVTVYNRACSPTNPHWCKGPEDPDVRLHATHTLFALSSEKLLILTNRSWACNPYRPPTEPRANPDLVRGAMFNFLEIQTRRKLAEHEVLEINLIIKSRANRYIAAGREEWLHPERHVTSPWRSFGRGYLLMPDPRPLTPGAEITIGYGDGSFEAMDGFGRRPRQRDFGLEARSAEEIEAHSRWKDGFERLFGRERRGLCWEDGRYERSA
jgi:hypothetical protein